MTTLASTQRRRSPSLKVWAALWTVYIVWGSTYLAIRVTVETLPPLLTGGARFLVAGAVVVAVIAARRGWSAVRATRAELMGAGIVGSALVLGGNGLVMLAERDISSSLAALLIASVPLWVVLLRSVTGDRVAGGTFVGVAVGFVGVALLVLPGDRPDGTTVLGVLLAIGASVSWATGSFLSTRVSLPANPFLSTGLQMLIGGAAAIVVGLGTGELSGIETSEFSAASLLAFAYLVVVGSLLAFTAYVWLLQNAPISKVSTYAYVNPVIAIFLGWTILSEELTTMMLAGAAIIVASVAFIVRKESAPRRKEVLEPAPALVVADGR
jgi:drug/metabolite transporter (DMT)-like permease